MRHFRSQWAERLPPGATRSESRRAVEPTIGGDVIVATVSVVLPAAGKSKRFGGRVKKPFAMLDNRPVWIHAVERFVNRDDVVQTILVIAADDREYFLERFSSNVAFLGIELVDGGPARCDSVARALERVREDVDLICVHDAARPCVTGKQIDAVFAEAAQHGAAILATPVTATLKRVGEGRQIETTVSRESLWAAQTPQVFRRSLLMEAYAHRQGFRATDEAQLVERLGHPVRVVPGSAMNLKISTQEDLRLAAQVLRALPKPKPNGPIHPFADDDMWR